jgi:hypothetical protein
MNWREGCTFSPARAVGGLLPYLRTTWCIFYYDLVAMIHRDAYIC